MLENVDYDRIEFWIGNMKRDDPSASELKYIPTQPIAIDSEEFASYVLCTKRQKYDNDDACEIALWFLRKVASRDGFLVLRVDGGSGKIASLTFQYRRTRGLDCVPLQEPKYIESEVSWNIVQRYQSAFFNGRSAVCYKLMEMKSSETKVFLTFDERGNQISNRSMQFDIIWAPLLTMLESNVEPENFIGLYFNQ